MCALWVTIHSTFLKALSVNGWNNRRNYGIIPAVVSSVYNYGRLERQGFMFDSVFMIMPNYEILLGLALAIIFIVIFFVIVMVIDTHRFVVRKYELQTVKKVPNHRIVLLSDLHNKCYGKKNEQLIATIDEIKPDYILLAGDILTAHKGENYDVALDLVKQLTLKYPVYYGEGNHEYRLCLYPDNYGDLGARYEEALSGTPVNYLKNTHKKNKDFGIDVCGLSIDKKYYKRFKNIKMDTDYIRETVGTANAELFQILIAHNPQYTEAYVDWGADLTVCGHVHGGLMRLPLLGGVISPNLQLFPKYDGGRFDFGMKTVIISRGLGTHTLPIRIFNPGELIVIDIKANV